MEEELNYATVIFKADAASAHEKTSNLEIIYDELTTKEKASDTNPVIPVEREEREEKKAQLYTLLHLVAAGLGIICVILVSVIVALTLHFNTVMSEQRRENTNLTAENLQLWTEKTDLESLTEELNREKDGLKWTIGVIMEYENFPVETFCPQKVCKPCLDGWVLFQLSCYRFIDNTYYHYWRTWQGSRNDCRYMKADLAVIDSQEEQEFINNHTEKYDDDNHGYWIGLSSNEVEGTWTWVDGSNVTLTYWKTSEPGYRVSCALTLSQADPLANWHKVSCDMRNRWICEKRALFRESDIYPN
ncbi:C-type lectin domain family 4 member M-like [Chaetodon trifascialis]|uniref:C-type lectin domain family 4 member M-like n=1 Tax=Chaetodon trifascialis TaxID=109706 RepID=UPI0039966C90